MSSSPAANLDDVTGNHHWDGTDGTQIGDWRRTKRPSSPRDHRRPHSIGGAHRFYRAGCLSAGVRKTWTDRRVHCKSGGGTMNWLDSNSRRHLTIRSAQWGRMILFLGTSVFAQKDDALKLKLPSAPSPQNVRLQV